MLLMRSRMSRLAETLAESAESVSGSREAFGNSLLSSGFKSFERESMSPERRMISNTPLHRHISPPVPSMNSTAAPAPSREAVPVCPNRPDNTPNTTDIARAPAHKLDIFVHTPQLIAKIIGTFGWWICMPYLLTL